MRMIYKICPAPAWREAERNGAYRGSADDRRDGFITISCRITVVTPSLQNTHREFAVGFVVIDDEYGEFA